MSPAVRAAVRACEVGDRDACRDLGFAYRDGKPVPKDHARAARYFDAACNAADAASCHELGILYAFGDGVERDPAKGIELYARSCDLGSALGCTDAGGRYLLANGVARDLDKGLRLLRRGCELDSPKACFLLAVSTKELEPRTGTEEAATLFDKACRLGEARACAQAPSKPATAPEEAERVSLATRQCEQGYASACLTLGSLHELGVTLPKDPARALAFRLEACDLGQGLGCSLAGRAIALGGEGVPADPPRAADLNQRACDLGYFVGCYDLGQMYARGQGRAKDPARALELLEKACRQRVQEACAAVSSLRQGAAQK